MAGCLNKTDRRNGRTNILMLFVKVQALKYERKSIGAKKYWGREVQTKIT